jgi:hypothetical protein
MSGDGKRRGPGALLVAGVFLGLAAAGYLAIELFQRHRFGVVEDEVHAVVLQFAQNVRFDLDEGKHLIFREPSESRGAAPLVSDLHWEHVGDRGTSWFLTPPLGTLPVVFVDQQRGAVLGPPQAQVNLINSKLTSIPVPLDALFKAHGLTCRLYRQ